MRSSIRKKAEGEPFDLDGLIGVPRNRIARVGIELEGGWDKTPEGANIGGDGSVFRNPATGLKEPPRAVAKIGEIQLGPMLPVNMATAVKKYYPNVVDHTCGLHVHVSFETLKYYSMLMDGPEYQETVAHYLLKWAEEEGFPLTHHIWPRLKGQNEFCQKKFWPDLQVKSKKDYDHNRKGHRYTMIAYRHEYTKTIECRVLPMMETAEQAVRGLRRFIDITNACLVVLAEKEKFKGEIVLGANEIYEEHVEEVI